MDEKEDINAHEFSQPVELVEGLVSIVVPCYNVEPFLPKFLDSLLAQTYKKLEVICVNDGSTDGTLDILTEYKPKLEAEGYHVQIMTQVNRGLGGAVNSGLLQFTGEFLMWPDPDDWLTAESVERRVQLMRGHPEIGLLRSNCATWIESEQKAGDDFMQSDRGVRLVEGFFWDVLLRRTFLAPVSTMVRSRCYLNVYPGRTFYVIPTASQNIQMLLPLADAYPVMECSEVLGHYRVRDDSRSKSARSVAARLARHSTIYEVMTQTLKILKNRCPELDRLVTEHYGRNVFLPMLCKAGRFREAWVWMKNVGLPWYQLIPCLTIIVVRALAGRAATLRPVATRLEGMFARIVKRDDVFAGYSGKHGAS